MIPREPYLPTLLRKEMDKYISDHIKPSDFLMSILSNDLRGAVMLSDDMSLAHLSNIVSWCCSNLPLSAWGSCDLVECWVNKNKVVRIKGNKKRKLDA